MNAVYHRGYDVREPIEVRVNPDSIQVLSYPGPDPSVKMAALKGEQIVSRRYRNRRIGEFLKELELAEGRFTGIPKIRQAMRQNGSPPPRFETDEERTFFAVELLIHPAFVGESVEAPVEAPVEASVDFNETEKKILKVLQDRPRNRAEIIAALGHAKLSGSLKKALERLDELGLIALTIPSLPHSSKQKRKLTPQGQQVLGRLED